MKDERALLRRNFINLFKRAEKMYRTQGSVLNAVYCAEIRRAICAVKLPKEPMGDGKEAGDGQGK